MKVRINIVLKDSVLDPQGQAITTALRNQGFSGVNNVRQGKILDMDLDVESLEDWKESIEKMCKDLLTNPQIETFSIHETE